GIEAEAVDVIVAQPLERVVAEEPAHDVAAAPIEIHGIAPRGAIPIREVRPETREMIPARSEVVVDDVHNDGEPSRVTPVDETLQPIGAAVRFVRRIEPDAVVSPAAHARKAIDGHELDVRDA